MKISLPFTIKELEKSSFHPLVEAELDGKIVNLIIDTGASRTVFNKNIVAGFPIISIDNEEPFAAGINAERMSIEQIKIDFIKIGGASFYDMIVFSTNLDAISNLYEEMAGIRIEGLLGCDFLIQYKAVLDFNKNHISLRINKKGGNVGKNIPNDMIPT